MSAVIMIMSSFLICNSLGIPDVRIFADSAACKNIVNYHILPCRKEVGPAWYQRAALWKVVPVGCAYKIRTPTHKGPGDDPAIAHIGHIEIATFGSGAERIASSVSMFGGVRRIADPATVKHN